MDQFSAHLDRGWDLVQRGDTRGAEASARRALEIDPNSPEAHNLLGFVAAMEGDGEEAIEAYRQAIALDDTYLEAMLNAAEVYIHPLGDYDQAIEMCDQALDLAEVDEEIIDALLLKFDALLGKGDTDEAAAVVAKIPAGPYDNPNHAFLVGRAHYEIGNVEKAAALIEDAAAKDARHAEAHYYLGLIRDERGDTHGATQAFLKSRELDLEAGMPPWAPTRDVFQTIADKAVASLNPVLKRYVDGADIYVSDVPGMELVAEGVDPRALVLLDGFPDGDRAHDRGARAMGDPRAAGRVFVYAMNAVRLAGNFEAIEREVTLALEREITATFLEAEQAERPERELN
jgi:Flp pilus assembly protein TadD